MTGDDLTTNDSRESPSNGGWPSFEARVRARRLAGCIERASQAITLGNLGEAREAVNEAKTLSADAPQIEELESRIARGVAPNVGMLNADLIEPEPETGWRRVVGMVGSMAVVLALFSFIGYAVAGLYTTPARPVVTRTDRTPPPAGSTSPPASGTVPPSVGNEITPQPEVAPPTDTDVVVRRTPAIGKTPAAPAAPGSSRAATPAPASTPRSNSRLAPPPPSGSVAAADPRRPSSTLGRETSVPAVQPLANRPPPLDPASSRVNTLPPASTTMSGEERRPVSEVASPTATATTGAVASSPSAPPAVETTATPVGMSGSRTDESGRIRTVLTRYETAYNSLDARAATSVWPAVDQRALGRAFDGLLSQRVSLGLCDITVIGDVGGASCTGKARWEPKVGGGIQTADRHWNFQLRKTDEGWKIAEIRVQ